MLRQSPPTSASEQRADARVVARIRGLEIVHGPPFVCQTRVGAGSSRISNGGGGFDNEEIRAAKPSIVFVHGIWADGSCSSQVIPTLQAEGYEVVSSQHSLDTLKGDVATVTRTLERVSSPAIL